MPSHYLIKEGDGFRLTTDKNSKNLNTAALLGLTSQTWSALIRDRAFESEEAFAKRQPIIKRLASALEAYDKRLLQKAPWYRKILALFGFKSALQEEVSRLASSIFKRAQETQTLTCIIKKKCKFNKQDSESLMRFLYHFILGNTDLKIAEVEGANAFAGLQEYELSLTEYRNTLSQEDPTYLLIQKIIEQIDFAIQTRIAQKAGLPLHVFMERLQLFLSDPAQGRFFIIPGGFQPKEEDGHHVLYEVEREENQSTFSFRLIDTGVIQGHKIVALKDIIWLKKLMTEPCTTDQKLYAHKDKIEKTLDKLKSFNLLAEKRETQDLAYTGLTPAHFSPQFFQNLFNYQNSSITHKKDMNQIIEFLDQSLVAQDKANFALSGRPHSKQKKGTCTQKAWAVWLHERLGDAAYQKFKVFLTEKAIKEFENFLAMQEDALEQVCSQFSFFKLTEEKIEIESNSSDQPEVSEQQENTLIDSSEEEALDPADLPLTKEQTEALFAILQSI